MSMPMPQLILLRILLRIVITAKVVTDLVTKSEAPKGTGLPCH